MEEIAVANHGVVVLRHGSGTNVEMREVLASASK